MAPAAPDLSLVRRFYAEEIRAVANVRSDRLVEAFATVPREHYVGPGPWKIWVAEQNEYRETPGDDPRHLYHNILVGLDTARNLNNGQPSALAAWLDELRLELGDCVLHVGCGVGYYTAVMADVVGPGGGVVGIEIDEPLATRATTNLQHLAHAHVIHGDGASPRSGSFDAIFINAGANYPLPVWLDALKPRGRMIVPLTTEFGIPGIGGGMMLRIENAPSGYAARFVSQVAVFHCSGARDAAIESQLKGFFARREWKAVQSLRRDPHAIDEACRLHTDYCCLSSAPLRS